MADPAERWPTNSPGRFYVDRECIDCDLCRTVAPDHFERSDEGGHSFVARQPQSEAEVAECLQALEDCPVEAIGDEASELSPKGV